VRALEGVIAEQDAIKREISILRELVENTMTMESLGDRHEELVTFGLGNFEVLVPFVGVLVQFSRIDTHPAFDTYENVKLGVNDHTVLVGG